VTGIAILSQPARLRPMALKSSWEHPGWSTKSLSSTWVSSASASQLPRVLEFLQGLDRLRKQNPKKISGDGEADEGQKAAHHLSGMIPMTLQ
jgi:hypothetical protein